MKNDALLSSAKQEIYSRLVRNKVLIKIYSKEQIRYKIEKNIKEIYTNVPNQKANGWCDVDEPIIVICKGDADGTPLTIDEIKEKREILEILIHEAIHAVLKNKYGTGMIHVRKTNASKFFDKILKRNTSKTFNEIGRGINEGYTNWLVEKSGIETTSYPVFTSIIRQLEMCLGEDALTKFAKGDYDEIFKIMKMTKQDGYKFIRQLDEIYYIDKDLNKINAIIRYLEIQIDCLEEKRQKTPEEEIELEYAYKFIKQANIETLIIKGLEQISKQEHYDDNLKNSKKIEFYKEVLKRVETSFEEPKKRMKRDLVAVIETYIIKNYIENKRDSPDNVYDYSEAMQLIREIDKISHYCCIHCRETDEVADKISKKGYEMCKNVFREIDMLLERKKFTSEALEREFYKISLLTQRDTSSDWMKITEKYAEYISNKMENPKEKKLLIKYFLSDNEVDEIENLSVKRTKSGKGIIFENGKFRTAITENKIIYLDNPDMILHEGEKFEDKIDWTITEDNSYKKIIEDFEKLKAAKLEQNPNFEIKISNGIISFFDGKKYEFYDIIEGEESGLKRVEFETEQEVKLNLDKTSWSKTIELVPITQKHKFITMIRRLMMKKTFEKNPKKEEKSTKPENPKNVFIGTLRTEQVNNMKNNTNTKNNNFYESDREK